uniref:Chemosensory protein n=1 Tax=Leucinodes orbonalis TaxID=711050 RepID=A0AAU0QKY8_9NEOP|nr:chemosensory protein [Leucinodes orbonalis]
MQLSGLCWELHTVKMRSILIALAVLECVLAQSTYTDRYDTIDLDSVLSNKRLTVSYIKCVLEKGRCTAEGRELKFANINGERTKRIARSPTPFSAHIIDALQNGCTKCTKAQREGMRRVIKHLITYEKAYWQELVEKYDPNRVFTQKYEKELNTL